MKLIPVTTARELKLPGVSVEFVTEGTSLKEVILRPEGEEESFLIKPVAYGEAVKVLRRVNHELKQVWRLSGKVLGVSVQEDFDTEPKAVATFNKLCLKDDECDLEWAPVMIRVDDAGEPVKVNTDDMPF